MGDFIDKLEKYSGRIMALFIGLQIAIFVLFTILYFLQQGSEHFLFNIYLSAGLFMFMVYMIHFAYHSVRKAYFIELIAFLIMSTLSSLLLIFNFFTLVINGKDVLPEDKQLYEILGIISVVILFIGNIVYYIAAYFAYNYFELIFMQKLGAKQIYHNIFSWIQFHHSMVKSDMGFTAFICISMLVFNNSNTILIVFDSIMFLIMILITLFWSRKIKNEKKGQTLNFMILRILIEGYKLYRVHDLLNVAEPENKNKTAFQNDFKYAPFSLICIGILQLFLIV